MELIINDLPQHGVLIHGPASPGFKDRLNALIEIPMDVDEELLRYSIIIENQSSRYIVRWSIVWRFYQSNDSPLQSRLKGAPITSTFGEGTAAYSVFGNEFRGSPKPGGQIPLNVVLGNLYLAWGKDKYGVQWSRGTGPHDNTMSRAVMNRQLASSVKLFVSIDVVLFDDGVFIGEDIHNEFEQIETQFKAARDLLTELNQKIDEGEDAFAHAEQCASITKEQIEALCVDERNNRRPPEWRYAWDRKSIAMHTISRRKKFGDQATIEWIQASAKSDISLVRR